MKVAQTSILFSTLALVATAAPAPAPKPTPTNKAHCYNAGQAVTKASLSTRMQMFCMYELTPVNAIKPQSTFTFAHGISGGLVDPSVDPSEGGVVLNVRLANESKEKWEVSVEECWSAVKTLTDDCGSFVGATGPGKSQLKDYTGSTWGGWVEVGKEGSGKWVGVDPNSA